MHLLALIAGLRDFGANVCAYDPEGVANARELVDGIEYAEDPYACAKDADALVIVTEWDAFRASDLDRIKKVLNRRYTYDRDDIGRRGCNYASVGRAQNF